jgi:hypothetical protein
MRSQHPGFAISFAMTMPAPAGVAAFDEARFLRLPMRLAFQAGPAATGLFKSSAELGFARGAG